MIAASCALVACWLGWKFIDTHAKYAPRGLPGLLAFLALCGATGFILWPAVIGVLLYGGGRWLVDRHRLRSDLAEWEADLSGRERQVVDDRVSLHDEYERQEANSRRRFSRR